MNASSRRGVTQQARPYPPGIQVRKLVRVLTAMVLTAVLVASIAAPASAVVQAGYGGEARSLWTCNSSNHTIGHTLYVTAQYDANGTYIPNQWVRYRIYAQTWVVDRYGRLVRGVGAWPTAYSYAQLQGFWRTQHTYSQALVRQLPAGGDYTFYVEVGWWNGQVYVPRGEWIDAYEQITTSGNLGWRQRCQT